MYLIREQRDSRKYTLHNADTTSRDVVIEHPARENWKLVTGPKPEETSASYLRFRVAVPAGQTGNLHIEEYHPETSEFALTNLDEKQVAFITQQRQITPAMQEAFRRVLDQKNKVDSLASQIRNRQHEVEAITKDQARLRENMKALKGSAEEKALLQRYTRQLDSQEDRLNSLSKEIADLQEKQTQARNQLDQIVQQIGLDETF
jgi:DNA repair exonuclease SbcCD ATPase subunit